MSRTKMHHLVTLALVLLLLCLSQSAAALKFRVAEEAKGVLLLDSITFSKIVPSSTHYVVLQVTNKHTLGDYGTDSIRADYFSFAQFAQSQGDSHELLFAQVIVNGGENRDIARSLTLSDDFRFPVMFVYPLNSTSPYVYPEEKTYRAHDLVRFLSQYTSFYYAIPGTSKSFDRLAKAFLKTNETEQRESVLRDAEEQLQRITVDEDKEDMTCYVKTMRRMLERGDEYLHTELARLAKIIENPQLSKAKRSRMRSQFSVLRFFEIVLDSQKANEKQREREEESRRLREAEAKEAAERAAEKEREKESEADASDGESGDGESGAAETAELADATAVEQSEENQDVAESSETKDTATEAESVTASEKPSALTEEAVAPSESEPAQEESTNIEL